MKMVINGQEMQSHTRENEPEYLKPWREADDLLKQGKVDEAAERICSDPTIDPRAEPPHSTLVYRVFIQIMRTPRVEKWLADAKQSKGKIET